MAKLLTEIFSNLVMTMKTVLLWYIIMIMDM